MSVPSLAPSPSLSLVVSKIKVANPVVEMDGDEMTRIIWQKIRNEVHKAPFRFTLLQPSPLTAFSFPLYALNNFLNVLIVFREAVGMRLPLLGFS